MTKYAYMKVYEGAIAPSGLSGFIYSLKDIKEVFPYNVPGQILLLWRVGKKPIDTSKPHYMVYATKKLTVKRYKYAK